MREPVEVHEKMSWRKFVDWGFCGLLVVLGNQISSDVRELKNSIEALNSRMAVIVEKIANQERRLDGLEGRVHHLEFRPRGESF